MVERIDVSKLNENRMLGENDAAIALVKWTNQSYHDENLRSMFNGEWDETADVSRVNAGRHRQQYYPGLVVVYDLSVNFLDTKSATTVTNEVQPTDIHIDESMIALAAGNRILVNRLQGNKDKSSITNPWFARLHSVERIGEDEFLTVSSAFDQIYTVNSRGDILKQYNAWTQGKNINKFGHIMVKGAAEKLSSFDRINPDISLLKEPNDIPSRINVVTDPSTYKGLGIPTYLTPQFVNHVAYAHKTDKVLATTLNSGECWQVDLATGDVDVVLDGLVKPHGLREYGEGYIVTDSGRERILILDSSFQVQKYYDLSTFHDRKPGLEKAMWLQNTTELSNGLLATISTPRQKITLIDTINNEYKDIPYDNEWGMQLVTSYPNK